MSGKMWLKEKDLTSDMIRQSKDAKTGFKIYITNITALTFITLATLQRRAVLLPICCWLQQWQDAFFGWNELGWSPLQLIAFNRVRWRQLCFAFPSTLMQRATSAVFTLCPHPLHSGGKVLKPIYTNVFNCYWIPCGHLRWRKERGKGAPGISQAQALFRQHREDQ